MSIIQAVVSTEVYIPIVRFPMGVQDAARCDFVTVPVARHLRVDDCISAIYEQCFLAWRIHRIVVIVGARANACVGDADAAPVDVLV